jgi:hypothetical protein
MWGRRPACRRSLDIWRVWRISFVGNFIGNFVEVNIQPTEYQTSGTVFMPTKVSDKVSDKERKITKGNVGWAKFGCRAGIFRLRGQAKRDPALARSAQGSGTVN